MAYEKLDKAAVARLAKAYEQKEKQKLKMGFWSGLLNFFGAFAKSGISSSASSELDTETRRNRDCDLDYVSNNESPNLMGGWVRFDNNYSPNAGMQDWD